MSAATLARSAPGHPKPDAGEFFTVGRCLTRAWQSAHEIAGQAHGLVDGERVGQVLDWLAIVGLVESTGRGDGVKLWRRPGERGVVSALPLTMEFPPEFVEAVAARAAQLVLEQQAANRGPDYLTVAEAAEVMRAKPKRVYDLIALGQLDPMRDGRRVLIPRAAVDKYLTGEGDGTNQRSRTP